MKEIKDDAAQEIDFAEEYAAFSSTLTARNLPENVIRMVETDIYDTLACAVAGISAPGVNLLIDAVADWGGKSEATVWCNGLRVPAHHAAWVNGMMSHARDFDDSHDTATLHAGVSVVPAALAAAELANATGADVIAGVAAGLELASRLGLATKASVIESGYLYTSLFGHFAATAAAARVVGFDKDQTINALGIAYSQAAGTHQVTRDRALTKRMQPGFAAKTALISIRLTEAGVSGARRTFEGTDGLFRTYLHGSYDPHRLRVDLGKSFDLLGLSFKMYPCCRWTHAAIDAGLELRRAVSPDGIRHITVFTNRVLYEVVGTPIRTCQAPETTVQAQFSIPYTVACALMKGSVTLNDFTEPGIQNSAIRALASKIDVVVDKDLERGWPRTMSPIRMVADTDQGSFEIRVDAPRGSVERPMTSEEFGSKLENCLEISGLHWPPDTIEKFSTAISGLERAPDISDLVGLAGRRRVQTQGEVLLTA
jgi:Uncharacterized protein involved in propionate catabolism